MKNYSEDPGEDFIPSKNVYAICLFTVIALLAIGIIYLIIN
jgi:hypothetical protein